MLFRSVSQSRYYSADDGNRYSFENSQWKGTQSPKVNQIVDFEIDGQNAKDIYLDKTTMSFDGVKDKGDIMKSGFVAMVGRPNVGKSTLTNRLCEEKVAIVSDKAGTTRDSIKGILTKGETQYVFIDTPGIHKPKHLLGEHMTNTAIRTLKEVDCILFILDGTQEISTGDQYVMERIVEAGNTPRIAVVTKSDLFSDEEYSAKLQEIKEKLGEYRDWENKDRKSTRLNSSHSGESRMPSSA